MSAAPFDVGLVQERLRALVPALRQVGGAADYAAVRALKDFPAPCAFVMLAREKGAANPPGHAPRGQQIAVRQTATVTFGVVHALRNYRERRGDQLRDELGEILAATRGALIGYVPDVDGARAIQWVQGDLSSYDAGTALWTEVYQTQHFIGGNA